MYGDHTIADEEAVAALLEQQAASDFVQQQHGLQTLDGGTVSGSAANDTEIHNVVIGVQSSNMQSGIHSNNNVPSASTRKPQRVLSQSKRAIMMRNLRANKTPEELLEYRRHNSEMQRKRRANKDPEIKLALNKKHAEKMQRHRAMMTEEQREAQKRLDCERQRRLREKRSDDERRALNERRSQILKERRAMRNAAEKEYYNSKDAAVQRNRRLNMSEEEKKIYKAKEALRQRLRRENTKRLAAELLNSTNSNSVTNTANSSHILIGQQSTYNTEAGLMVGSVSADVHEGHSAHSSDGNNALHNQSMEPNALHALHQPNHLGLGTTDNSIVDDATDQHSTVPIELYMNSGSAGMPVAEATAATASVEPVASNIAIHNGNENASNGRNNRRHIADSGQHHLHREMLLAERGTVPLHTLLEGGIPVTLEEANATALPVNAQESSEDLDEVATTAQLEEEGSPVDAENGERGGLEALDGDHLGTELPEEQQ